MIAAVRQAVSRLCVAQCEIESRVRDRDKDRDTETWGVGAGSTSAGTERTKGNFISDASAVRALLLALSSSGSCVSRAKIQSADLRTEAATEHATSRGVSSR